MASRHQSFDTSDLKALVSVQPQPLPTGQGAPSPNRPSPTPSSRAAAPLGGRGSGMPCTAKVPKIEWGGQLSVKECQAGGSSLELVWG